MNHEIQLVEAVQVGSKLTAMNVLMATLIRLFGKSYTVSDRSLHTLGHLDRTFFFQLRVEHKVCNGTPTFPSHLNVVIRKLCN